MLITKEVEVKLSSVNIKHFENLEYKIPKYLDKNNILRVKKGTIINVKVEDLSKGSNAKVDVKCDCEDCKNPYLKPMPWYRYINHVHKDGKYYCNKCSQKLYAVENGRKTKLKNGKSFYDWCYENLSKEEADKIMLRWDYELNINKYGDKLNPKDISYGSMGFDKKGYWFKCLDYHEHKSELKSIKGFTKGQKGSLDCLQCNTISITHPYLIVYLVNKKDAYKYSYSSGVKIPMKCPDCGYEKDMNLNTLSSQGFSCCKCGSKKSYPEKFLFNLLEQLLNKNFKIQLSNTIFKWCGKYKYDFYIDKINMIIETHGLQHYKGGFERIKSSSKHIKTLEEIQQNDKIKEQLAKENGITNYIVLDCRNSNLEWIKNNVMNSDLPKLLNFNESDIDWLKCHEYACKNLIKEICYLWKIGESINNIAEKFKLHRSSIIKYLKQGVKLGWCNYNPKEEIKKGSLMRQKKNNIKIICLTTNEVFNSIIEACKIYNISNNSSISGCCKNNKYYKSAGKLPDGTKLKWMYYEDYLKII